jgi:hypothetical protein
MGLSRGIEQQEAYRMIFGPENDVPDEGGAPGEYDYKEKAEALRAAAAAARISKVNEELLSLARQYEQLGKFAQKCLAVWLLKLEELTKLD